MTWDKVMKLRNRIRIFAVIFILALGMEYLPMAVYAAEVTAEESDMANDAEPDMDETPELSAEADETALLDTAGGGGVCNRRKMQLLLAGDDDGRVAGSVADSRAGDADHQQDQGNRTEPEKCF